jgi:hypothetical protein
LLVSGLGHLKKKTSEIEFRKVNTVDKMKLFPQVLKEKQVSDPDHRVILWLGDKGIEEKSYSYSQVGSMKRVLHTYCMT